VFFVCAGCNETLKKNQVDKHAQRCRVCEAVTCVDCQVTFYGDDYAAHTTCISEAEKYEKSLFKGNKVKANPQDQWMDVVLQACTKAGSDPAAPSSIKQYMPRIAELNNIPRNEKKFGNFVKNSLRLYNDSIINDTWKYINSFRPPPAQQPSAKPSADDTSSSEPSTKAQESTQEASSNSISEKDVKVSSKKRKIEDGGSTCTVSNVSDDGEDNNGAEADADKLERLEKEAKKLRKTLETIDEEIESLRMKTLSNDAETKEKKSKKKDKKDKKKQKKEKSQTA
jgi:cell growth-regulating nucleolar protein